MVSCGGIPYHDEDEEPIFVLRAQDRCFVPLVRLWIELLELDAPQPMPEALSGEIMEAVEIANRAIDWQNAHPERVAARAGGLAPGWYSPPGWGAKPPAG
jgi:hypothetical protein